MDSMDGSHLKLVFRSQYFLYFGVLGVFLPYFNLYCYHLHFSGFQIGTLSAVRTLTTALFPMLWGLLADRLDMRRQIYIACSLVSTGIWSLYLATVDFRVMLAITILYGAFYAPVISFLEAFTIDFLGGDKANYGRIRAWGSISFIATVLVVGKVIELTAVDIILSLILAGAILQTVGATLIPAVPAAPASRPPPALRTLLQPRIIIFLFCACLMLASHGTYYGFFSIHLESLGFGGTFIGLAWALASGAEILVMVNSRRIFRRISMERVLVFSFFAAAGRWFVLSVATSAAVILLSQLLHALTYGAFHMASILYIDRLIPQEAKTLGQAANNAVTYGVGMMAGFFINGYLFERVGSFALFAGSGFIALCGGVLLVAGTGVSRLGR
jgi:MFS transporter, PPP family, 3-phenylpropionic acid transporter